MIIPDLYKPIRNIGYAFVLLGTCGFLTLVTKLQEVEHMIEVWFFVGSVSLFHLLLGISIIRKRKKRFGIFIAYLKLLQIGYPLGTLLSKQTLEYIKKYNIERQLR
jgi:hypothetical protein